MLSLAARVAVPAAALLFLQLAAPASATNFTCASPGTSCRSAIGYAVPNATTYAELAARFNATTTLAELLGANGLPAGTSPSAPVAAKATVRVPFRCRCGSNGVAHSDGGPVYVVQPQDGLDHIARDVFGAFVTYQEIATANGIKDVNLIYPGQKLLIPLPCTCDPVDGAAVMHFAYSVAKGGRYGRHRRQVRGERAHAADSEQDRRPQGPAAGADPGCPPTCLPFVDQQHLG